MFPLWDVAIAPVLAAAGARRVVEIGALRGETTVRMLNHLGPDGELHVIDPAPEFDPRDHERQFPGRYFFHRAPSLDVLPALRPMDAALIDGDHNWYTVVHELRALAEGARRAGAPVPVLVMHDVGWPYGRRDLYYAPERVPAEFRQPYATAGMRPGRRQLLERGGLNPTMHNAEVEGGPRNGVMTALDDFVTEHDQPVRRIVLPIYFGLAIVAEESRLSERPALAAALDRLESAEGRYELMEVAEKTRLQAMIFQHNVYFERSERLERATARHLGVVKAALLNEHYLDHEVRFAQLADCLTTGRAPAAESLRDPARHDQVAYRDIVRQRTGRAGPDAAAARSFVPYTAMGRTQLDHLERCLDIVSREPVDGDLVECGTGRGGGAIFMRSYLEGHELDDRTVWVADRFRSSTEPDLAPTLSTQGVAAFQADLNLVRDGFERFGVLDDRVRFLQGSLAATLPAAGIEQAALLRIGRSAGDDVRVVLDHLYDKVAPGGFVVIEAGAGSPVLAAVEAFRRDRGIDTPLDRVDSSAVSWRRTPTDGPRPKAAPLPSTGVPHAPLAPGTPSEAVDLSVVVVFYNMRREAERTLHSLSRAYQEGVDDISYEVIAVENGSDEGARLGESFVAGFGTEYRYLDIGPDAGASPVAALNRGIRAGRGRAFALMIDGAHVVTPGVVRFGLAGLEAYAPSIVVTQPWYVGPGQQGDAMHSGYDQHYEDRLFERIRWPTAGYRLFEISHFSGDRDWLDGMWESNCLFVSRAQLTQVGCFDESFSMPGGGYANLELYERLGSSPDVSVATIIGEGSFHQLHGGTTTNQADPAERRSRIFSYGQHFAHVRGRPFKGPGKPIHYVGRIGSEAARRSKLRRLSTKAFDDEARAGVDGRPETPTSVPDELKVAFTEAVWRSLPWRGTTWLGRPLTTAPTDLLAYQEAIASVRPDWVIETGTGDGGRALYLASICELVGHGQVLSIGQDHGTDLLRHARLRYLRGVPHAPSTVEAANGILGNDATAVVILCSCADRATTVWEFEAYARFVPVGSYAVITDTIVNGHPVWPAFGPGPMEAVKQILGRHGDFVPDPRMEKYALTFNPGGFLRRVN